MPVIHFTVCCHNFLIPSCDFNLVLLEIFDDLYLT